MYRNLDIFYKIGFLLLCEKLFKKEKPKNLHLKIKRRENNRSGKVGRGVIKKYLLSKGCV